jgi:hypothetical protein
MESPEGQSYGFCFCTEIELDKELSKIKLNSIDEKKRENQETIF